MSLFLTLGILLSPQEAEAKFIGTDTSTNIHHMGAGQCLRTTVTKFKVFWITVSKSVQQDVISC